MFEHPIHLKPVNKNKNKNMNLKYQILRCEQEKIGIKYKITYLWNIQTFKK